MARGLAQLTRPADAKYVCSSNDELRSAREGPKAVDESALAEHMTGLYASDLRRTARAGLHRIVPDFSQGPIALEPDLPLGALANRLWRQTVRAVGVSMNGAKRVAIAVGGLDSSGILAAAVEHRPASELLAVTLDFDHAVDVEHSRELCRAFGIELQVTSMHDALPDLTRGLVLDGLPYWSISGAHELALGARLGAQGVDRMLTGAYGDDVLGGSLTSLTGAFARHPLSTARFLASYRSAYDTSLATRARAAIVAPALRRLFPRWHGRRIDSGLRARAHWLRDEAFRRVGSPSAARWGGLLPVDSQSEWHAEVFRRISQSWGPRAQLVAATGIARADPFLDPEFVSFATAIPFDRLAAGGVQRGLFRRALPSRVPERVRHRLTKADATRDLRELARRGAESLRPYATVERLVRRGWVDAERFRHAYEREGASPRLVWATLSAEAFLREVT